MKVEGEGSAAAASPETFELVPLADGIHSLRSLANGQTFHPVVGPAVEARTVHVAGTRLVERANALPPNGELVIWDVGLGAAANALAAVNALAAGYKRRETISLYSFDRTLDALDFALDNEATLGYLRPYVSEVRSLLQREVHVVIGDAEIVWETILGDFPTLLGSERYKRYFVIPPHAIFHDPYSPTVNPEMWTLELFAAMHRRTDPAAPCLLTTYTRSTAVRATLLLAGWFVGVGGATGEKDETTVAANDPALLDRPLTRDWLEKKVYASTNAAPLRAGAGYTRGPISEEDFARLRGHLQFR